MRLSHTRLVQVGEIGFSLPCAATAFLRLEKDGKLWRQLASRVPVDVTEGCTSSLEAWKLACRLGVRSGTATRAILVGLSM